MDRWDRRPWLEAGEASTGSELEVRHWRFSGAEQRRRGGLGYLQIRCGIDGLMLLLIARIYGLDFLGIEGMGVWVMMIVMFVCNFRWIGVVSEKLC